jgi:hypothetical protein
MQISAGCDHQTELWQGHVNALVDWYVWVTPLTSLDLRCSIFRIRKRRVINDMRRFEGGHRSGLWAFIYLRDRFNNGYYELRILRYRSKLQHLIPANKSNLARIFENLVPVSTVFNLAYWICSLSLTSHVQTHLKGYNCMASWLVLYYKLWGKNRSMSVYLLWC